MNTDQVKSVRFVTNEIDAWCVTMKYLEHSNCRLALDDSKKLLCKEGNVANNFITI